MESAALQLLLHFDDAFSAICFPNFSNTAGVSFTLILRRSFDVVDDNYLASPFDRRELQPELLLDRRGQRRFSLSIRIAGLFDGGGSGRLIGQIFQADIVLAGESRLIDDRMVCHVVEPTREL